MKNTKNNMIRIAIQSKGRLNEQSVELLQDAGLNVNDQKRKFLDRVDNFPIEILYLRDDDIPQVVADGSADIGIVGYNEVAETEAAVDIVRQLGFGGCRISLAIPKGDEYTSPQYFQGKRIATSYPNILGRYFKEQGIEASVRVIKGSVEIAPAAGIADAIFDIVSSGGTLVSNGLKEVEKVVHSEAVLIATPNLAPEKQAVLDSLLFRIDAVTNSRGKKYILMNLPADKVEEAIAILPAMRSPSVMPLADSAWCSLHSVVKADELWEKIERLKQIGAEGILVLDLDKVIE
jgi:ATP phosphoribosyltransferase